MIPDASVFWVIGTVLVLVVILNALLFKPLVRVMTDREQTVRSGRALGEAAAARASAAAAEIDGQVAAARADVYRRMDEMRRELSEGRAEQLSRTRQQAEAMQDEAMARLGREAAGARARLDQEANALASVVAERVLGRKVS